MLLFFAVNWECLCTPKREDSFCKKHKYLETKKLQERLDDCAEKFNFFRHPCELCNEHGHLNLQCKFFHDQIVSKHCDNLITLEHHKELILLLGYEEMKRITKGIPKFNLEIFLDFDLEEIYMFCAVNCIENPYIANYLKSREQIEYEESTNERDNISQKPPSVYYDESGNEEELLIQPISSIRSLKRLIKPTHDVVKKKKRRKKRGKKVSLPNNVSPIIVVPHENESKIIVEDDALDDDIASMSYGTMTESTIDDDFVMPIARYDDYDWEDNNTSYNLGNLFGTNLGNYHDSNCYTVGAIHTINDESDYAYDMPSHKLGDAMFDENDMFENLFAAINVCPKLGDAMFNEDDLFSPPTLNDQTFYDGCMPPIYDENKVSTYDDYCDDTYVIKSSDNYCHNFEYHFTKHYSLNVGTIFIIQVSYDTPTIVNENKIAYVESNKFSMLMDHEENALCNGYIDESIHDATSNYYERGTYDA